ncbi:hypothetical protein [Methyloceanibacter caenitepidi]|uniref:Uncharacterized protein n=1 Tax=Methyloceanibacter caenitepidi TaxID=1384459 RepID=A0A0A8K327_9HYPH|nr:hypothetical protein [Methyloceanibacter caenitepidi]BAQ17320.1 hypothetical protein GL4_1868 [Methyloceanibacter caenitepidi]
MNSDTDPAKIHIDLRRGVIEAEGDAAFVKEVYEDFKAKVLEAKLEPLAPQPSSSMALNPPPEIDQPTAKTKGKTKNKAKGKGAASAKNGKLDKDLNLYGGDGAPSLKDYLAGFEVKNNKHKNVVFISYLKDKLELEPINIDHIFTCYHVVDKLPKALRQSLYDTGADGYIYFSVDDPDITLAPGGMNWLKDNVKPQAA